MVEQEEVLYSEVEPGALLSRQLKFLSQVANLLLVVLCLLEFLFNLLCRLFRLL